MKKILGTAAIFSALAGGMSTAHAMVDVDVTADFLTALVMAKVNDMAYGVVELGAPINVGDTAQLNTDGTIVYAGNFTGIGTGTAGAVDITAGTDGRVVDVFCDATAGLTNATGASSINVTGVGFDIETGTATVGTACVDQVTPAGNFVLTVATNNTILLGGLLDGGTAAAFVQAPHATTNPGGSPITVDVQYQ